MIQISILYLLKSILLTSAVMNVTKEILEGKDSAFDEIQTINRAANLDLNHPLGKHVVEGDIMTRDGDMGVTEKRMVILDDLRLWRTREVPYVIAQEVESSKELIKTTLNSISEKSCLKFVERSLEENFLHFVKRKGCWSALGMQNGGQEISLDDLCDRKEIIEHLILHALGMFHESARGDREEYIKINWDNIKPELRYNFREAKTGVVSSIGIPYDTKSLMHYGKTAFGDGSETLESITDPTAPLGNKEGMTENDAKQLNKLYKCETIKQTGYGPFKLWASCAHQVKRLYRVCYGKDDCEQPNNNGIQHIRMKCDESQQAVMKGCYRHGPDAPYHMQLQKTASKLAFNLLHSPQPHPFPYVVATAFLECMKHAKKSNCTVFGIANVVDCYYGDDEANINKNPTSENCGDGHGNDKDSIFMYRMKE